MNEIIKNTGRATRDTISRWDLPVYQAKCLTYWGEIEVGTTAVTMLGLLLGCFLLYLMHFLVYPKM